MTQEDKDLLLKDLCARLPYGVIVKHFDTSIGSEGNLVNICTLDDITTTIINEEGYEDVDFIVESKPYLRPMSSMTDEEKKEFYYINGVLSVDFEFETYKVVHLLKSHNVIDWLNAHHFDYRGLIEKGLALEAPEGMYQKGE